MRCSPPQRPGEYPDPAVRLRCAGGVPTALRNTRRLGPPLRFGAKDTAAQTGLRRYGVIRTHGRPDLSPSFRRMLHTAAIVVVWSFVPKERKHRVGDGHAFQQRCGVVRSGAVECGAVLCGVHCAFAQNAGEIRAHFAKQSRVPEHCACVSPRCRRRHRSSLSHRRWGPLFGAGFQRTDHWPPARTPSPLLGGLC